MPTYEYECKTCGCVFDIFQSITAKPLRRTECEKCGEVRPVRRLIGTGGALIFKGSGFYQTDYRSEGYKKAQKSETDSGTVKSGETGGPASPKGSDSPGTDSQKADSQKTDIPKTDTAGAAQKTKKSATSSGKGDSGGSTKARAKS